MYFIHIRFFNITYRCFLLISLMTPLAFLHARTTILSTHTINIYDLSLLILAWWPAAI